MEGESQDSLTIDPSTHSSLYRWMCQPRPNFLENHSQTPLSLPPPPTIPTTTTKRRETTAPTTHQVVTFSHSHHHRHHAQESKPKGDCSCSQLQGLNNCSTSNATNIPLLGSDNKHYYSLLFITQLNPARRKGREGEGVCFLVRTEEKGREGDQLGMG